MIRLREFCNASEYPFHATTAQFPKRGIFREMAAKFQANVKKRSNNVWGSILQEDALTSEMTGIGVGRTLKVILTHSTAH